MDLWAAGMRHTHVQAIYWATYRSTSVGPPTKKWQAGNWADRSASRRYLHVGPKKKTKTKTGPPVRGVLRRSKNTWCKRHAMCGRCLMSIPTDRHTHGPVTKQGRSFAKQVVGAEPVKTTQSTIKILEFLCLLGFDTLSRSSCGSSDPSCGAQAHTTEYETTPL